MRSIDIDLNQCTIRISSDQSSSPPRCHRDEQPMNIADNERAGAACAH